MIIKGSSHSGKGLASYLMHDKNDRAEVLDIRGDLPRDLKETLDDWRSDSLGTQCSKPLYHAQINPDRVLTAEEWEKAIGIFEKAMGFENQPRVIVLHEYKGREHAHLVYSRIDEQGKAISDSWNYVHHEKAAREIERELGLEKTPGVFIDRAGERPERTPSHGEMQQGERTKLDPHAVKAEVSALYRSADSGRAFVAALDDAGYTLARGDQRGYVLVDEMGGVHSLSRMAAVKADGLRETLRDFPLHELPSVDEAKEMQQARQPPAPEVTFSEGRNYDGETAAPPNRWDVPPVDDASAPVAPPREDNAGVHLGQGALNSLADSGEALANVVLDFLVGDGRPPPTPEQQKAWNERAANWQAYKERQARYAEDDRQKREQEAEQSREQDKSIKIFRERER